MTEHVSSQTVKTHLLDVFVSAHYGRREQIKSKFLEKGNAREEDSITLLSRHTKILYIKNKCRLTNEFITGEPDLSDAKIIQKAKHTVDTKTSWSAHTFFRAKYKSLDANYKWQGHGYMWLTGAKRHTVAYCLVNGTPTAIMDEKYALARKMGIMDISSADDQAFKEQCRMIERNHIFDLGHFMEENPFFDLDNDPGEWSYDVPIHERVHTFEIERDEVEIERIKNRVFECWTYIDMNFLKPVA